MPLTGLELEEQFNMIRRHQAKAEQAMAELQVQRQAIQDILKGSSQHIAILGERESLIEELGSEKKHVKMYCRIKLALCRIVENVAEKDGFLYDAFDGASILSLKGILQVLIQKNLLVQSEPLQHQWQAMKERGKPEAQTVLAQPLDNDEIFRDGLLEIGPDIEMEDRLRGA